MKRIPLSTYRLQMSPEFGFRDATEIISFLSDLGISDIYLSPIFKARKGSSHGYDVVDPNRLSAELGGEDDFRALSRAVKRHGMGWLQDIVPNHMAFDGDNGMLMDVLENGSGSAHYNSFDIDWNHPYESMRGRLLAPFLGRPYGESLEDGEIELGYDSEGFYISYHHLRLRLEIGTYVSIITHELDALMKKLGDDHADLIKILGVLYALKSLPPSGEEAMERSLQVRFIKRMLRELYLQNADIRSFIDGNVRLFNGTAGRPESFNLLDALLAAQHFRLCFWKVATEEINYRRFFDINGLISLRAEEEKVFAHTHSLILSLVQDGTFTGLRIDHLDGLHDPAGYLRRLRKEAGDIYIVVEKILALQEPLSPLLSVNGTTGYDFLNYLTLVFCDRRNERSFSRIYARFSGLSTPYEQLIHKTKKRIIDKHITGDIDNLSYVFKKIVGKTRHGSDMTLHGFRRAIVEVLAFFPVYRTYAGQDAFDEADRRFIGEAIKSAKRSSPGLLHELDFIEEVLLLKYGAYLSEEERGEWLQVLMRFQQFTAPLVAKGFEDTALYVYNRLLSLNEVGGSPRTFGVPTGAFHSFSRKRARSSPFSLNATSTHDTKRGEDMRARISVLSEIPRQWERMLKIWSRTNRKKKRIVNGEPVPDRNEEYFLYQTLIGAFPFHGHDLASFVERMKEYIRKSVREADIHTAWLKPDEEYEEAFISFLEEILTPSDENDFLREFIPFQRKVAHYGVFNSLSQTLIKVAAPGIPDFYQGTELWDLNLVDPDNRRPVDFLKRAILLREIIARKEDDIPGLAEELLTSKEDGRIKLFLVYRALKARKEQGDLFPHGRYIPVASGGRFKGNVIAFARAYKESWALVVAPRFFTSLIQEGESPLGREVWENTTVVLPEGSPSRWRDLITGQSTEGAGEIAVGTLLTHFPVALLAGKGT